MLCAHITQLIIKAFISYQKHFILGTGFFRINSNNKKILSIYYEIIGEKY